MNISYNIYVDIFGKTLIFKRRGRLYVMIAFAVVLCALLLGCSASGKFSLSTTEISLYIGDTRDIKYYVVFTPATAENKNITLSTQSDCVEIDGTKITAVNKGTAEITVKSDSAEATLTVNILYRSANNLTVSSSALNQTVKSGSAIKPVEFAATLDGYADPDTAIAWTINGKTGGVGKSYTFTPSGYGEYTVCATAGELTASKTVKVFRETTVTAECTGSLNQTSSFSAVHFSARENIDTRNPLSVYEWSVNGVPQGGNANFEFTPTSSGEYVVTLKVNGEARKISGNDSITIRANGARSPRGEVVFDDIGGTYVKWADGGYVTRVSIVSSDGVRVNIDRSDAQHAYRFERGAFKLDGLIDVCSAHPTEYKIILAAEGVSELTFTQYPIAAQEYLDSVVLCRNRFISSGEDGCKYIAELYACGKESSSCYIARGAERAVNDMRSQAERLGLDVSITHSGNIAFVQFSPYANKPIEYSTGSAMRTYTVIPHIEYGAENRRAGDYVLALDRIKNSVEVESSEQLLYAAMNGVRPVPKSGSAAAAIYSAARNKLISIIGANCNESQKLHAIYDWLQWVSVRADACGEAVSGRYLEGVFGGIIQIRDGVRQEAVTSEGAAKAFALLACMEGIPCVIQSMTRDGGMYFWNKVQIGGLWYNVDVYGGEIVVSEIGLPRQERLSHRGLLISDDDAEALGLHGGDDYEAYDCSKSYFLQKHSYGNEYFDYYIDKSEKDNYSAIEAAVYNAFGYVTRRDFKVPFVGRDETYMNNSLGVEFELDAELSETERQAVLQSLSRAVNGYAEEVYGERFGDNAVSIKTVGNYVYISATIPSGKQREEV